MSWVIEARNNEMIPEYFRNIQENPVRYKWDTDWYIVDRKALKTREAGILANRPFHQWDAMEPTTLEECTEALVELVRQFEQVFKRVNPDMEVVGLVQWRIRNVHTGEEIPGEILSV